MLGFSRNDIARLVEMSNGTVTNIVAKWESDIGVPEAKAFRELAKSIRSAELAPAQCATGLEYLI